MSHVTVNIAHVLLVPFTDHTPGSFIFIFLLIDVLMIVILFVLSPVIPVSFWSRPSVSLLKPVRKVLL